MGASLTTECNDMGEFSLELMKHAKESKHVHVLYEKSLRGFVSANALVHAIDIFISITNSEIKYTIMEIEDDARMKAYFHCHERDTFVILGDVQLAIPDLRGIFIIGGFKPNMVCASVGRWLCAHETKLQPTPVLLWFLSKQMLAHTVGQCSHPAVDQWRGAYRKLLAIVATDPPKCGTRRVKSLPVEGSPSITFVVSATTTQTYVDFFTENGKCKLRELAELPIICASMHQARASNSECQPLRPLGSAAIFEESEKSRIFDAANTIHFKGFARGMDFNSCATGVHVRQLITFLRTRFAENEFTLVWDGDAYGENSFTSLIPVLAQNFPRMKLHAFKYRHEVQHFKHSWAFAEALFPNRHITYTPVESDDSPNAWEALGRLALAFTQCKQCVCFGGGATILGEHRQCPEVQMYVIPATRWNPNLSRMEHNCFCERAMRVESIESEENYAQCEKADIVASLAQPSIAGDLATALDKANAIIDEIQLFQATCTHDNERYVTKTLLSPKML